MAKMKKVAKALFEKKERDDRKAKVEQLATQLEQTAGQALDNAERAELERYRAERAQAGNAAAPTAQASSSTSIHGLAQGAAPAGAAPVAAPPVVAVAPNAPRGTESLTASGLPDIWNYTSEQVAARGPAGMRADFERILAAAHQQSGRPRQPQVPAMHVVLDDNRGRR